MGRGRERGVHKKKRVGIKQPPPHYCKKVLFLLYSPLNTHTPTHTYTHTHDGFLQGLHTAHTTTLQRNSGPTPFLFIFSLRPPSLPYVVFFKLVETLTTLILSSFALFQALSTLLTLFL